MLNQESGHSFCPKGVLIRDVPPQTDSILSHIIIFSPSQLKGEKRMVAVSLSRVQTPPDPLVLNISPRGSGGSCLPPRMCVFVSLREKTISMELVTEGWRRGVFSQGGRQRGQSTE